jgi:hypothetical protein
MIIDSRKVLYRHQADIKNTKKYAILGLFPYTKLGKDFS